MAGFAVVAEQTPVEEESPEEVEDEFAIIRETFFTSGLIKIKTIANNKQQDALNDKRKTM